MAEERRIVWSEAMELRHLREKFGTDGVDFLSGPGDLPVVALRSDLGEVIVALNGAHVLNYQTADGISVLWRSQHSNFQAGKPIRGGIPLCWPWFGPHPTDPTKPSHGFARTSQWALTNVNRSVPGGGVAVEFGLSDSPESRGLWPHRFALRYRVAVIPGALRVELTTVNSGSEPFTITAALHSYFGVPSIEAVRIHGFDGSRYLDQLANLSEHSQSGPISFTGEVDRIYTNVPRRAEIVASPSGHRIEVESEGSRSSVIWNPWIAKARRMPDFGDEEYREMVCLETANAGPDSITLKPSEDHSLAAMIRLK